MAIISRQTSLLAAENWKKLYQTFREADFSTYDFETLRKSMLDYLKLYYPEDFNDFTESSEFIALIDLIAFMGQSLAFRTDLNARENFLDTAERRDSVLKLAKLVSYNPKRAISASGFLKIENIATTENVYDSNSTNLSGVPIIWNDISNDNWLEQFTVILNACLVNSQIVGKPGNSQIINSIMTDEYSINLIPSVLPLYKFSSSIEGTTTPFEAVSASSVNNPYIYEVPPKVGGVFTVLYKNDNLGNSSNNTGFFFYFKQGNLASFDFSITDVVPNKSVNVPINSINNADGWLYSLDSNGNLQTLWSAVPAVAGINVIYNNTTSRNLYQVNSKAGDQIDLVFGDGAFANIPQGNFRYFYRTANGLGYKITPDSMQAITLSFNYVSRTNRIETITFRASLGYTVSNAAARESISDIKQKAPQQYYTQNRMITGEDYNILPYTTFSSVTKVKALNRTSIGLSKYLDMLDTTGNYSSSNMFGQDGVLYRQSYLKNLKFSFLSAIDIRRIISTTITDILKSQELLQFYYVNFPATNTSGVSWHLSTTGTTSSTGYFIKNNAPVAIGGAAQPIYNERFLKVGAIVRFSAPNGYYFNSSNNLISGSPSRLDDSLFLYASISEILGDGTNYGVGNLSNGIGPVTLNVRVPTNAFVNSIIPVFKNNITDAFNTLIVDLIYNYKNFGLAYNGNSWFIVYDENLQIYNPSMSVPFQTPVTFSLSNTGNRSGTRIDASWLIRLEYNVTTNQYTMYYRGIDYIFHSPTETNFFFDKDLNVFDTKVGKVIRDNIKILKTNSLPDSALPLGKDYTWNVHNSIIGSDGYSTSNSIYITFSDTNNDGVPDNPNLFETIIAPIINSRNKYVFFKSVVGYDRFIDLIFVDNKTVFTIYSTTAAIETNKNSFDAGQIFYATTDNLFYQLTIKITEDNHNNVTSTKTIGNPLTDYIAYYGRQELYYQYRHITPSNSRIDPSTSNIIDLYVLTSEYNTDYRNWILDNSNTLTEPEAPTNISLETDYAELNNKKALSDTIVFQSAKFKPIFGNKAPLNLQSTFKVVKNPGLNISDADIKTSVINTINVYFDITNWDFGDTFYFSELAAYLHRVLSPNIASIIIVPNDDTVNFGSLYQINAEANEIIISSATVDNVEIITAVTSGQLNQSLTASNRSITF